METDHFKEITIGEIVANDYRAASIFKEAGIDFCCGGYKILTDACKEKGSDLSEIVRQLSHLTLTPISDHLNFREWEPAFLCDYIVNTHHKFVMKHLPELVFYTGKIADVHGIHHPELPEVAALFLQINIELSQHLRKEEEVLFPAVKNLTAEAREIIVSEISRMKGEHEFAGSAMDKINDLTNHYHVPEDACNTYRVALKMLEQFEDDLHMHVHLENNILYPKALKLAQA